MNLASALIKQIIDLQDSETWASVRQDYLPSQYHTLFKVIEKHGIDFHALPTFEDLTLSIRDASTKEKLYAIQAIEVDVEPYMLLQYLKNEFAQKEILNSLEYYIEDSVAFEDAEESLAHLYQIVIDVENKIDLEDTQETMEKINLFESASAYDKLFSLGINSDFDLMHKFTSRDLILMGGYRGSGKSVTCANIAVTQFENKRSSITFSTEMDKRSVLRRMCSIATGIDATRLRMKNLTVREWGKLAAWWASRFSGGLEVLNQYNPSKEFDEFHSKLTSSCVLLPTTQLDVVYDPRLTIAKIHSDLDKKLNSGIDPSIIIVDYLNKVKLNAIPSKRGVFDWVEQIEIATALKGIAAEFEIPVFAPFQTKEDGGISFSKGILIDADAAYTMHASKGEDSCIKFKCIKMRDGEERDFTSIMDWNSLKIGPESAVHPEDAPDIEKTEETYDDDPPF